MDQEEFRGLAKAIFEHSPAGSDDLMERVHFTNDGVLAIAAESTGKVGFGVASGITVTEDVLTVIHDLNRLMPFGHYWLAPGSDSSNWSLICGFKFQYESISSEHVVEIVVALMKHNGAIVDAVRQKLSDAPHSPYWLQELNSGPQAIVLTGHLG